MKKLIFLPFVLLLMTTALIGQDNTTTKKNARTNTISYLLLNSAENPANTGVQEKNVYLSGMFGLQYKQGQQSIGFDSYIDKKKTLGIGGYYNYYSSSFLYDFIGNTNTLKHYQSSLGLNLKYRYNNIHLGIGAEKIVSDNSKNNTNLFNHFFDPKVGYSNPNMSIFSIGSNPFNYYNIKSELLYIKNKLQTGIKVDYMLQQKFTLDNRNHKTAPLLTKFFVAYSLTLNKKLNIYYTPAFTFALDFGQNYFISGNNNPVHLLSIKNAFTYERKKNIHFVTVNYQNFFNIWEVGYGVGLKNHNLKFRVNYQFQNEFSNTQSQIRLGAIYTFGK